MLTAICYPPVAAFEAVISWQRDIIPLAQSPVQRFPRRELIDKGWNGAVAQLHGRRRRELIKRDVDIFGVNTA